MAFSCMLRSSFSICKAHPSIRVSSFSPITTFAYDKLIAKPTNVDLKQKLSVQIQGINLNAVRKFTTTSVKMSSSGGDHGKLWTIERYMSAALIPVAPLAVMYPNILFDLVLAVITTMHIHWGVEAIVVDYVRPIIFGNIIPKISHMLIYVYSILLLVGLLNLTFRGQGIGNSIKHFWSI